MEFPIQIKDEQQLNRLVYTIAEEVAEQTTDRVLLNLGLIKPMLSRAECYRLSGGKRFLVDKAIMSGKLKFVINGTKVLIRREDFNKWLNKKM